MPEITRALLRKRAEHNEGMISTLEELTLHQEELESINDVINMTCHKLKILYLQNNLIPKMENLFHMKDLEYLNLALNNIQKIEGLQSCEFLKKLDLTVNFIDYDTLQESINHLQSRDRLADLYLMGNPSTSWDKFNTYVIAKLPQLKNLDGTEITRSMQIQARQQLPKLEVELAGMAGKCRTEKAMKAAQATVVVEKKPVTTEGGVTVEDVIEEDEEEDGTELTENTPETRIKIYKELAAQKKEKEDREKQNQPKERNYEAEQKVAIEKVRQKELEEATGEIKQRNEGGWDFYWDEEDAHFVKLEVKVAKFLDSSLIDVDVHPSHISVIIKSKTLRLRLPAEVKAGEAKCQRSKVNGSLLVIMPKVDANENAISLRGDKRLTEQRRAAALNRNGSSGNSSSSSSSNSSSSSSGGSSRARPKKLSLQEQMLKEAMDATSLNCSSPSSSSVSTSLLDADLNKNKNLDLASIVRKPRDKASQQKVGSVFEFDGIDDSTTEGTTCRVIEELD